MNGDKMQIGDLVRDRVYGGNTPLRLGIVTNIDVRSTQVFVRFFDGTKRWSYPDNVEVVT